MTFMNCQKNNVFREIMNSSEVLAPTASGCKRKYLHAVVCETDSIWLHQTLEPQKTRSCISLIMLQICVLKALIFYHAARHNVPTGIHHITETHLSKELNLATIFNCGAVTEMISYNSSEQADHFTSVHLCKIRARTCFFPSSGLSFRKKHASLVLAHSPCQWTLSICRLTFGEHCIFYFITVCWIAFNKFSPWKKLLRALIWHNSTPLYMNHVNQEW